MGRVVACPGPGKKLAGSIRGHGKGRRTQDSEREVFRPQGKVLVASRDAQTWVFGERWALLCKGMLAVKAEKSKSLPTAWKKEEENSFFGKGDSFQMASSAFPSSPTFVQIRSA